MHHRAYLRLDTIQAVLFDKDGTFVDFAGTWTPALVAAMQGMAGGDAAAFDRLCRVNEYDARTGALAPTSPFIADASADLVRRWADALGVEATAALHARMDALLDEGALRHAAPLGNPASVFSALRARGLKIGVVTNDTERGAAAQCVKLGLDGLVDTIIGYDSGYGRKPAAGQLMEAARRFCVAPDAMAMVGDTSHDLLAGRAAGALRIGVASGFASTEELAPFADIVLNDISALPALFDQLSG